VIRRVDPSGVMTIVVGNGTQGFSGDGGQATAAALDSPAGVAVDGAKNLYIADSHNHRVRRVDGITGVISTIAGNGSTGFSGDGGAARLAELNLPVMVAVDGAGNIYIADTDNFRIRKIAAGTGVIGTVAGNGVQQFSGDGGLATAASIDSPSGLAVDGVGNLYIADTHNHRVRVVSAATGVISTVAGTGVAGFDGDGAAATGAALALPRGVSVDATGNVFVADANNQRIRRIAVDGTITTVVGAGAQIFLGDGGTAIAANLDTPRAAVISPNGQVTIADTGNGRVRQVSADTTGGSTVPGTLILSGPSVITYGTGSLTATLVSSAATGSVSFFDGVGSGTKMLGMVALIGNVATLSAAGLDAGQHSIYSVYSGDATHTSAQSATSTLTVNRAASAVAVFFSSLSVTVGQLVSVTLRVASTTSGTPTGSVALLDGGVLLATLPLSSVGSVGYTSSALALGTHALTAVYAGDGNFTESTIQATTLSVTALVGGDFTLATTGAASQTILSGGAASFAFAVQMQGAALASPIVLAASTLPVGMTATFSPTLLPPGGAVTAFTLTVQTTKTAVAGVNRLRFGGSLAGLALLLFPFVARWRRRWGGALVLMMLLVTAGCGDRIVSSSNIASASSYPITVTGTATGVAGAVLQHTATVTLTVQ
jgi:sugar lactone lactonase YvrE